MADSAKLASVLDYLPCEACYDAADPDQELLCSVCHRADRTIAVKVVHRRTVIIETPVLPAAPVEIVPARELETPVREPPLPAAAPIATAAPLPTVVVRSIDDVPAPGAADLEVVIEPVDHGSTESDAGFALGGASEPAFEFTSSTPESAEVSRSPATADAPAPSAAPTPAAPPAAPEVDDRFIIRPAPPRKKPRDEAEEAEADESPEPEEDGSESDEEKQRKKFGRPPNDEWLE